MLVPFLRLLVPAHDGQTAVDFRVRHTAAAEARNCGCNDSLKLYIGETISKEALFVFGIKN